MENKSDTLVVSMWCSAKNRRADEREHEPWKVDVSVAAEIDEDDRWGTLGGVLSANHLRGKDCFDER